MGLAIIASWAGKILDVKGEFLHEQFQEEDETCYMEGPQGFEKYHENDVFLMFLRTLYRLKNAAKPFWKELFKAFNKMKYRRRKAYPCIYFTCTIKGIMICLSWIIECICFVNAVDVEGLHNKMKQLFDCDDVGNIYEYVRCKVERK